MNGQVLLGPFLTRRQAARRAYLATDDVRIRPDLLRVGGRTYKEAYFAFQFGQTSVRRDIGTVVLALRSLFDDVTIADWLVRGNPQLMTYSPLVWMNRGGDIESILTAAATSGPVQDPSVRRLGT